MSGTASDENFVKMTSPFHSGETPGSQIFSRHDKILLSVNIFMGSVNLYAAILNRTALWSDTPVSITSVSGAVASNDPVIHAITHTVKPLI